MKIIFLCGARDYHAMDWYQNAKKFITNVPVEIVTDLIEGEGYKKLVTEDDIVNKLIILDSFLFKQQSHIGDVWRNILKLWLLPLQSLMLRKYHKRNKNVVYHAHGMYYMFLAKLAGVNYLGTPQGSEILVRPYRSYFYKKFALIALSGAKYITVDSESMRHGVYQLCGKLPIIIQNGIDIKSILDFKSQNSLISAKKKHILSIRGITPLYRIQELVLARNKSISYSNILLLFIYPFVDDTYLDEIKRNINENDQLLGRLDRKNMYKLLATTQIVISIPISDSSPRSVYESIFLDCVVIIVYNKFYDILPECMKQRIVIVDLTNPKWFDEAIVAAEEILKSPFVPTADALELFDQEESFKKISKLLFAIKN